LRIGLFGGAFNPPHVGHLVCAQEAHAQLGLDVVVWMPVGRAPHREIPQDPGAEARHTMCDYATAADERFGLSRIEIEREGPSYTLDTLRELARRSNCNDIVLILGGDQAAALPSWHEPEEVMRLATVAVAERAGGERGHVEAALDGHEVRLEFFAMPRIDISSTLVRERAAAGLPIRYLVPDKVANFIGAQSLYGAGVRSG
jgi:nicotinate-nucleotide adenylyltransferase